MPDPLIPDEWWASVGNHLDKIEAGCRMAARHAAALACKPPYVTLAESDLRRCEIVLGEALAAVRKAQVIYRGKPVENQSPSS